MRHARLYLLSMLPAMLACNDTLTGSAGIVTAGDLQSGAAPACAPTAVQATETNPAIQPGQAIALVHRLPEGATNPIEVDFEVSTFCVTSTFSATHKARELDANPTFEAAVQLEAPLGSECGLVLSVEAQNDTFRCYMPVAPECNVDCTPE